MRSALLAAGLLLSWSSSSWSTVAPDARAHRGAVTLVAAGVTAAGMAMGGHNLSAARRGDRSWVWSLAGTGVGVATLAFAGADQPLAPASAAAGIIAVIGSVARLPRHESGRLSSERPFQVWLASEAKPAGLTLRVGF